MPKISIIVPTYNRAKFVPDALDSILSQTFRDYEVIVVDDGSTDETRSVLMRYGDRIRYVYQTNRGVSAARNVGIRHATGGWLAFLDSDDKWLPDYLSCQADQIDQHPTACMFMTNSIRFEADGAILDVFRYFSIDSRKFTNGDRWVIERPLTFILEKGLIYLQATIFNREAFLKAGLFNETMTIGEDVEAVTKMCLLGALSICNKPLVHIVRRKESISNLSSTWAANNMYCRESLGTTYESLLKKTNLTTSERIFVNKVLSANKKSIGNLYLTSGEVRKARSCYEEALQLDPSPKSLLKILISYLPRKVALACIKSRD